MEATANYYAARAADLTGQSRIELYGGKASSDYSRAGKYLSVPITASNDNSMYSLGHFLEWLTERFPPDVAAGALRYGQSQDLLNLGGSIQNAGGLGLTSAFGDYVLELITHPEDSNGFHGAVKRWLEKDTITYLSGAPRLFFTDRGNQTFVSYKKRLAPLSAGSVVVDAFNDVAGMLVVDASGSQEVDLEWAAFPFRADDNGSFETTPLSAGIGFRDLKSSSLAVEDFGRSLSHNGIEMDVVNSGTVSNAFVNLNFYLLLPPEIVQRESDRLVWNHSRLGNIPRSQISGYNV